MRRRKSEQQLRGSDPTTLVVQIQDLLRVPMGQLAPPNLMDLLALAEMEEPPNAVKGDLPAFVQRVSKEIVDLPPSSWDAFLEECDALEGGRVPGLFRDMIEAEQTRDHRDADRIGGLLAKWSDASPVPFELGVSKPAVTRGAPSKTQKAMPARRTVSPGAGRARPGTDVDEDKVQLLSELCLERLGQASEAGLKEAVLIAGVRHRARTDFPNINPHEVTGVLKALKDQGRVRYSAGRWSRASAW